jgi:hypothetical protein
MLAESSQRITAETAACGEKVSVYGEVVAKRRVWAGNPEGAAVATLVNNNDYPSLKIIAAEEIANCCNPNLNREQAGKTGSTRWATGTRQIPATGLKRTRC